MRVIAILGSFFLIQSCATHKAQFGSESGKTQQEFSDASQIDHDFFLIGDAGNWTGTETPEVLALLSEKLKKADTSSTLIFLGDNIYPHGLPKKDAPNYEDARSRMEKQLSIAKDFKGKTYVIPGNHDYYSGLDGVRDQAKLVNELLGKKNASRPKKGCALDAIEVGESVAVIFVDSQWFLEDWDTMPTINNDCDIKTREMFYKELGDKINDYQNKTIFLVMHHPLASNGAHGGEFSFHKHIFPINDRIPLPIVGTFVNILRKSSGLSPQDLQNAKYNGFIKRVKTLIQNKENVLVVSGHDHNLEYIERDGIKQIISGSGSKTEAARIVGKQDFSFGENGFAQVRVKKDGATNVTYFAPKSDKENKIIFETQALPPRQMPELKEYPNAFAATKDTSVYTKKMTKRSGIYRFFWGEHFRSYYSTTVRARQVSLDTLYGGLKPLQAGGGHQSMSLRLGDKDGKEYVMRAVKKSATRFLQTSAFLDQAIEQDFKNTYTEKFLLDFYTTSHPYSAYAVSELSESIGIPHSNPELFYIPKQKALGLYNHDYGDELYLVEERPMEKFTKLESFGKPDDFVSTDKVLEKIHSDEDYKVDKKSWIRARVFDMLIGDWDRHQDQWRFGEYKEGKKTVYKPIPRDRDQAFSKPDGALLSILMNIPALRHMKKFDEDFRSPKWTNRTGYPLDLAFVPKADESDWVEQAKFVAEHLTDAEIDAAFKTIPKEVQDETIEKIKSQLKQRRAHLEEFVCEYYKVLLRKVLIVGTEKKDKFVITRSGKQTKVEVFRLKKEGEIDKTFEKTYSCPNTKEIWVYALGDEDIIEVKGKGRIKLRLLGGNDNDNYSVEHGNKVHIYDFKSQNDDLSQAKTACKTISDDYELNSYDYRKPVYNVLAGFPMLGFNPDDGVKIGAVVNYTVFGFDRDPFTQKHSFGANYYFATSGFELNYKSVFPKTIGNWSLVLEGRFTSPNFSQNFFGFGNDTPNFDDDDDLGMDYNRVKIRSLKAAPSLQWKGVQGASAKIQGSFEQVSVDDTFGRFISQPGVVNQDVFEHKNFVDFNGEYRFDNYDNNSIPTLGFSFSVLGGYKANLDDSDRNLPYAETGIGITYKITPSGRFVFATSAKAKFLFNDEYEFFQAVTVGGDSDIRGFRNQRFSGQRAFYQSTDLRWNIGRFKTAVIPMSYGILGGFDYGRVWLENDSSDKWHNTYGGGFWINGVNLVTARVSYFYSSDGGRIFAGLGFGF